MMNQNKKVALAVSGGIDSAISAFKLKELGYEVTGINFKFWKWEKEEPINNSEKDTLLEDIAKKIGFEINILEYDDYFKKTIVDHFLYDLSEGFTPNPCVRCNPMVKYKLLEEFASKKDIDFISTGHYARVLKNDNGTYSLLKAFDQSKDQSYVLNQLVQATLSKTIFPLGETYKVDNIEIAKHLGLKSADIGESQDLCFVSPDHYQQFINKSIELKPGDIVNQKGNKLGEHQGLELYTIGQRKGINISAAKPYYVLRKDMENNKLVIGHLDELGNIKLIVGGINWIKQDVKEKFSCDVKIRYRSQSVKSTIEKAQENKYIVTLSNQIRDITPGQYAVFYDGDEVLGGGIIIGIEV